MAERCVCSRLATGGAPYGRIFPSGRIPPHPQARKHRLSRREREGHPAELAPAGREPQGRPGHRARGRPPDAVVRPPEGFTAMFKVTAEGKRQITAFHIPGDIPDLQSLHLEVLDTSLATLTRCKVGFIQHEALQDLCDRCPRIAKALWRETLIDAAIFREWTVNVGRREAYARIAHILCELMVRLQAVGLTQDHTVQIPITQNEFADATGLSNVHVNRVLQALRSDGLILLKGDTLQIPDWDKLKQAGDFDATYLHLQRKQEAA